MYVGFDLRDCDELETLIGYKNSVITMIKRIEKQ